MGCSHYTTETVGIAVKIGEIADQVLCGFENLYYDTFLISGRNFVKCAASHNTMTLVSTSSQTMMVSQLESLIANFIPRNQPQPD